MIQVKFKNLEKSELAKRIATERIAEVVDKFPKGTPRSVIVTLSMENSPLKTGPDLFTVRTEVVGGRYHGLILEKSAKDLYLALADVSDRLLERFNRHSDRVRVKAIKSKRQFSARMRGAQAVLKAGGE